MRCSAGISTSISLTCRYQTMNTVSEEATSPRFDAVHGRCKVLLRRMVKHQQKTQSTVAIDRAPTPSSPVEQCALIPKDKNISMPKLACFRYDRINDTSVHCYDQFNMNNVCACISRNNDPHNCIVSQTGRQPSVCTVERRVCHSEGNAIVLFIH